MKDEIARFFLPPSSFILPELRRWDLNPRGTAYETVLASRLQSTPQYSRQDSNLRCAPCEGAAVAAGPRE